MADAAYVPGKILRGLRDEILRLRADLAKFAVLREALDDRSANNPLYKLAYATAKGLFPGKGSRHQNALIISQDIRKFFAAPDDPKMRELFDFMVGREKQLKADLAKFGGHTAECATTLLLSRPMKFIMASDDELKCDCGWAEIEKEE